MSHTDMKYTKLNTAEATHAIVWYKGVVEFYKYSEDGKGFWLDTTAGKWIKSTADYRKNTACLTLGGNHESLGNTKAE